jgi:hypothetical protein
MFKLKLAILFLPFYVVLIDKLILTDTFTYFQVLLNFSPIL